MRWRMGLSSIMWRGIVQMLAAHDSRARPVASPLRRVAPSDDAFSGLFAGQAGDGVACVHVDREAIGALVPANDLTRRHDAPQSGAAVGAQLEDRGLVG